MDNRNKEESTRTPSLTDVEGILVGHHTLEARPTGCTVITARWPFVAGIDVRGGAPGTRETDLLRVENTVGEVNAVLIAGGSAFGLDSAAGVMKYLEEQGRGFEVGAIRVPIVCAAILFDLMLGDPKVRPDAGAGYAAARDASDAPVAEGNVGAGAGCTVGKMLRGNHAMKSGLGSWSQRTADGLVVGALVAVNAVGDIVDPGSGKIIAGARSSSRGGFLNIMEQIRRGEQSKAVSHENTVVGVVATNAALTKAQCTKVAQMAQDGLARCISPSHTPWDGDTVFAIATGKWASEARPVDVGVVGALAADVLATAILRGIRSAESWGDYPAATSWSSSHG
jgi:L-aminopeptidase/D-esterase-like protein